jgi:dolichol-phosphate mannosyltransferase
MDFSLIIPLCNEEDNIEKLVQIVPIALAGLKNISEYEIIFIDDGSTDNTFLKIKANLPEKSKIIKFKKRYGQTSAIAAGLEKAQYENVGIMDGDLQTDAKDFDLLIEPLNKGYQCVSGWRFPRKEGLSKRLSAWFAMRIRNTLFSCELNDISSSMIVFKKNCVSALFKFDTFHRYIPLLCEIQALKVKEVKVMHYPRIYGKSKYGFWNRIWGFGASLLILIWMKKNYLNYQADDIK